MAHIAEDLAAGLEVAPQRYPNPGEKWRHYKEGKVGEVLFFEFSRGRYLENEEFNSYPMLLLPKGTYELSYKDFVWGYMVGAICCHQILPFEQCVVYLCSGKLYVRAVKNFLERFEDGVYRFERV